MRKLSISAIVFASCASFLACGRGTSNSPATPNSLNVVDASRYKGDESTIKDVETSSQQTLADALKAIEAHRADVQSLDSYRLTDYGQKFWVGDGFDVLTGSRSPTCLDPDELRVQVRALNQTSDTFDVVHSYVDLYHKLETDASVDVGGAWEIFTGKASFKSDIMNETTISADDVVVLASFSYVKDQIALYNSWPTYAKFFEGLSQKNKTLFRKYCGDRYTRDVSVGAGMYMVFTAKKVDNEQLSNTAVESAISIGLSSFLTAGGNVKVTDEQKRILQHYSFSAKCYSAGTSADVCGAYSLSTAFDITSDTAAIQNRVQQARQKIVSEVNDGKNLVAIKETLVDFDVPFSSCTLDGDDPCPNRWSYFVDYRDRLGKTRDLGITKSNVEEACFRTDYWAHRCAKAQLDIENAIVSCMNVSDTCKDTDRSQIDIVLSAKNPGKVGFWTDTNKQGSYYELDFGQLVPAGSTKPSTFYNFNAIGWSKANDKISSLDVNLNPAWTIRLYQDMDPQSPGHYWDFSGKNYVSNIGKDANDKISAYALIPIADLP